MSSIDFREYSAAFHRSNDDIYHFGILGMKWGVRRYQNPDGTLTDAGRKRYDKLNNYADNVLERYPNNIHAQKVKKKAAKYGTPEKDQFIKKRNSYETDEEKDDFERTYDELLKNGFKSNGFDGYEITDKKSGNVYTIDSYGSHDVSKNYQAYKEFKKNESYHLNKAKKEVFDFAKTAFKDWDLDLKDLKESLDSEVYMQFNNGLVEMSFDGGKSLGYHSIDFLYDPKSGKFTYEGING